MQSTDLRRFARLLRVRWSLCAAPLLALGCACPSWLGLDLQMGTHDLDPHVAHTFPGAASQGNAAQLVQIAAKNTSGQTLSGPPDQAGRDRVLLINLDTVLRLAEEQNGQVALAREKLYQSEAERDLASLSWLPQVNMGLAYYRHEGGIQNENGTLTKSSTGALYPGLDMLARLDLRERVFTQVNAEREIWQRQGELSKVTSDTLLDAAQTYVDLLTARTAESALANLEDSQNKVLRRAEALAKEEKSAEILVETIRIQTTNSAQTREHLRQSGDAAGAKLAYLLGLGRDVVLVPADSILKPIVLVDPNPTDALVDRALAAGPGIRELEGLLATIQEGLDRASGPGRLLPVVELRMMEGAFGAGPGSSLFWDDRWDMGVQARWNLTDLFTAKDKTRVAHSRLQQVHLSYQDLRAKLTLGVQDAQSSIESGRKQMDLALRQIQHAEKTYRLSDLRLEQRVEGSSTGEVLGALRALEGAQLNSLNAIRAYNKAQIRLMVLIGAAGCGPKQAQP